MYLRRAVQMVVVPFVLLLQSTDLVGLSLFSRDGSAKSIELVSDAPRYLPEIEVFGTITTTTDRGLAPLSHLRQRAYREPKCMGRNSTFVAMFEAVSSYEEGDRRS